MAGANGTTSPPDPHSRIAELERRLKDIENTVNRTECALTEQHDSMKRMEHVHKSAMGHLSKQLKDVVKQLETEQYAHRRLESEICSQNDKIVALEKSLKAIGAYGHRDQLATTASASSSADCPPASDGEPKRKRVKLDGSAAPDVPKMRTVPCTKCYTHGWKCDDREPCANCKLRHKHRCRRIKCKFFKTGTCPDKDECTYAHEEDAYKYLTPHRKIFRNAESAPEPAVQQEDWEEFVRQGGTLDGKDAFEGSHLEAESKEDDDDEFGDLMRGLGK